MTRIAGLPNTESNRALDMYHEDALSRRAQTAASFSPPARRSRTLWPRCTRCSAISRRRCCRAAGVEHFDAWAANFGEPSRRSNWRRTARATGCTRGSRNSSICRSCCRCSGSFADVQTADMLHLPRPAIEGGKPHITALPRVPGTEGLRRDAGEPRAEAAHIEESIPPIDNMLKITGDGRKAALDMRLVDPFAQPEARRRLSRAVAQIFSVWEAGKEKRSTQLVFCDLSTPNPDRFNVYDEIRDQARSPEAFRLRRSPTSMTPRRTAQKKTLFDAVNAGRVRILLGSTEKMGAGTNVQKRLDRPPSPRRAVAAARHRAARGPDTAPGQRQYGGPDLPLCHRRIVRRLYVAVNRPIFS